MFQKILVANRGEIALRIIWACKELGIRTVAVYSTADEHALHRRFADEDICIGPPSSKDSYLNIPSLISAAEITGAEAIHPGYGFLSENGQFIENVESCGLVFIGPGKAAIQKMGDKSIARKTMIAAGVPVVPGSPGPLTSWEAGKDLAEKMGYPVLIKASAGGGGRGMRVVTRSDEFQHAFQTATSEASVAFGNGEVYLEKFLVNPRHVEVQILGDHYGKIVYVGDRECSVQRRHQKVIEEAPCAFIQEDTRKKMGEMAVLAAKAVGYYNAGTVEFLVDDQERFYFMEMNTRIQVEHGITELTSGLDLVKWQIQIASGKALDFSQEDLQCQGHAIECRLNAEDPRYFRPSPGRIQYLYFPGGPGVRVDSAAYEGYTVPHQYDSMVGKIMAFGRNREEAIKRMQRVLDMTIVSGIETNIPLHQRVLEDSDFWHGKYFTKTLEEKLKSWEHEG
jgi:acetyl-CoA carboxylase biotin carboxylase subunit